ncbi:MAG TPA: amino acid adenylation domain-containing protein [Steroidobacteraceae bacterium]
MLQHYVRTLESLAEGTRAAADYSYPLTPTQQGILFHSLYDPHSDIYLSSLSGRLDGPLEPELFRRAWNEVIRRHDVLRTSFSWEGLEKPIQRVHAEVPEPWHEEDLSTLASAQAHRRWQELLETDRGRPFDLTQPPLTRLLLCRSGPSTWRFNWSHHHILLDGWSSALLLNEAAAHYEALSRGESLQLPAPPPFRDYVNWLHEQDFAAAGQFWKSRLAGFDTPTTLVQGRPQLQGSARPGRVEEAVYPLTGAETQRLTSFAHTHHLTLNTLVQGAWALLLSRYGDTDDVLFGTIVSGRPAVLSDSHLRVGLFIATLPVRVRIPDGSAASWLTQLQLELGELEDNAFFPLADIQKLADLPAGTALFESLLIFQNYPSAEPDASGSSGIRFGELQVFDPNNYPLTLFVTPGEYLSARALYDSGRFDNATMRRLLRHFATLLMGLAESGSQSLHSLPMLTESERHQLLTGWNDTFAPLPAGKTVLDLIEETARSQPTRIALRCGTTLRTYDEIRHNSDRIAWRLLERAELQPDDRVAVLMERSATLLETILAIWKCGAAYVPIDPTYPPGRVESILSGARPKLVVTDEFPFGTAEQDPIHIPFVSRCAPGTLAYVIFTSGSTGKPKGAMLEQDGMLNHVWSMVRELELSGTSVVAQTASHCSDISVWQLFAALVAGGQTVIYPNSTVAQPELLIAQLHEDGVTVLQFVPSYLAAFLPELEKQPPPRLPKLGMLITIGEALQPASVRTWFRLNPHTQLMNAYGPTEASDSVAHYVMDGPPALPSIPIGKPIQNLRLHIVDHHLNLCPIGVKGEICITGVGVGRGYLFDDERTRAVFGSDPFSPPGRLYHTGDVGCRCEDGNLLFFGRRDFQVKVRGYRIELGEIETALSSLPRIRNAVVVTRTDAEGNVTLHGFAEGTDWTPSALREALRRLIPSYMVPEYLMLLPQLPVTPNGKINRAALPVAAVSEAPRIDTVAPQSDLETHLIRLFAAVLAQPGVGAEGDFFELGGQSLKAIQLVSRLRSELNLQVSIADLFSSPTPRALARKLEHARTGRREAIPVLPARPWYPVSHAQKRIWLASRTAEPRTYNMAGALQIEGPLDMERLEHAFEELRERQESLRTVFVWSEGELRQKVLARAACGFQLRRTPLNSELESMVQQEADQPFDLASGPLLRARLVVVSPQTHVLVITLHHIIADAWSIKVLGEELRALYAGSSLGPLPIQYRDYAVWHTEYVRSEAAQPHRQYWLKKLTPEAPRLELPLDFPRPAQLTYSGGSVDLELPANRSAELKALGRLHHTSLYNVVLSSICVLLLRCTGSEDLVIGTASAGRDREPLEKLIGVFLNTLILRVSLRKTFTIEQVLATVASASAEALEHAMWPFDRLVEELGLRTPVNRFPLFDIQVDYIPSFDEPTDTRITELLRPDNTTKFDLTFHITEKPDGLLIRLVYNTQLFRPRSIAILRERLERIQDCFLRDPRTPIEQIPLTGTNRVRGGRKRVGLRLPHE